MLHTANLKAVLIVISTLCQYSLAEDDAVGDLNKIDVVNIEEYKERQGEDVKA